MQNWGWACEKVVAIDAVTAKGELIHCSSEENADLLWSARGAGPGFPAIVVRFYLEVRKSYSNMMASAFIYPKSEYNAVLDWVTKVRLLCPANEHR